MDCATAGSTARESGVTGLIQHGAQACVMGKQAAEFAILRYSTTRFDFPRIVGQILGETDLSRLGSKARLPMRTRETDQRTRWHRRFYSKFAQWRTAYDQFLREVIAPLFNERFYYQAIPSLRIQLPNNIAVGEFHTDRQYGHPDGEVTFWLPMTPACETNSLWIEGTDGAGFVPVSAVPGEIVLFDACHVRHGNVRNTSGVTRVSFDFRCLRERDLVHDGQTSVNSHLAFVPGSYYSQHALGPLP